MGTPHALMRVCNDTDQMFDDVKGALRLSQCHSGAFLLSDNAVF